MDASSVLDLLGRFLEVVEGTVDFLLYGRFFLLPSISRLVASAFAAVARFGSRVEITWAKLFGLLVGDMELSFGDSTFVFLGGAAVASSVSLSLESLASLDANRFEEAVEMLFLSSSALLLIRGLGVTTLLGIGLGTSFGDRSLRVVVELLDSDRFDGPRVGGSGSSSSEDESNNGSGCCFFLPSGFSGIGSGTLGGRYEADFRSFLSPVIALLFIGGNFIGASGISNFFGRRTPLIFWMEPHNSCNPIELYCISGSVVRPSNGFLGNRVKK